MKRIFSIFIASALLAAALAGCSVNLPAAPRDRDMGEYAEPVLTDTPGYSGTPGY